MSDKLTAVSALEQSGAIVTHGDGSISASYQAHCPTKRGIVSVSHEQANGDPQRLTLTLDQNGDGIAERTLIVQPNGFGFGLIPTDNGTTINRTLNERTSKKLAQHGHQVLTHGGFTEASMEDLSAQIIRETNKLVRRAPKR